MAPCNFKVVIVGGSVAGLSLAKMLETVGIDFVVLEAYPTIAPQVGASIGLLGNGLRILDQLGCYEDLRKHAPDCLNSSTMRSKNGVIARLEGLDTMFIERLGYPFVFMDRQTLLKVLFNNITAKSKIHVDQRVTELKMTEAGVTAITKDGSEFKGDIVVGGDGIRSTVRQQMWKIANKYNPGYIPVSESKTMKSEYACMFGISRPEAGRLRRGEAISILREHHSCFVVAGPEGRIYWFLFIGHGKTFYGDQIPRYTKEDEEQAAKEYSGIQVNDDVVFADLYSSKVICVMTALEECVFKKWHYGRIMTIGDAAHKIHPLSAQGGNSAIESAAALVNFLTQAQEINPQLSTKDVQEVFQKVQELRHPRTVQLMRTANKRQRIEAMETPLLKFFALNILPLAGYELIFQRFYDTLSPAGKLDNLPVPIRPRLAPFEDELPKKHRPRGSEFIGIAGTLISLSFTAWKLCRRESFLGQNATVVSKILTEDSHPTVVNLNYQMRLLTLSGHGNAAGELHGLYFSAMLLSFVTIFTVECSRKKNKGILIWLPLLWGFLFQKNGFGAISPLYFLADLYSNSKLRDFLIFGNVLPISRVMTVLPTALIGYLLPTVTIQTPFNTSKFQLAMPATSQFWTFYASILAVGFSIAVSITSAFKSNAKAKDNNFKVSDVKFIYVVVFIFTAIAHIGIVYTSLVTPSLSLKLVFIGSLQNSSAKSPEEERLAFCQRDMWIFIISSLTWLIMSISEICRVGISTLKWERTVVPVALGSVFLGPGSVAVAVWYWRERVISKTQELS